MARVDIKEPREQEAHFGLYRTSVGGDESIIVRRKVGEPVDYMHSNSVEVARQREILALASQHYAGLSPSQKAITRHQIEEVEYQVAHGQTDTKLLMGRQLFVSKEIRSLASQGTQLVLPYEVCVVLCDEFYSRLWGELWLFYLEDGLWVECSKEQLGMGNWLFSQVPVGKEAYRIYGEALGFYDPLLPHLQYMPAETMLKLRYHVLLHGPYYLLFYEPWSDYTPPPPPHVLYFYEPWTLVPPPPPEMMQLFYEPWTAVVPEMELLFIEPWTLVPPPPPEMGLILRELWTFKPTPPFAAWVFWDPWGTYLTEFNNWFYFGVPPEYEADFEESIITITNEGYPDIGIDYLPPNPIPLVSPDGYALHLIMGNPDAEANDYTSNIALAGLFKHPTERTLYFQLMIAYGESSGQHCPFGVSEILDWDWVWQCVGLGEVRIDLLHFWQRARIALGKSTDPTGWTLDDFHFGLALKNPEVTDFLKNDYLGLYYATVNPVIIEPWTRYGPPPPTYEQKMYEPWSS